MYLVAVSPKVVLGTDILVCVLGLVLPGSVVSDVLPVGIPPQLGVDAGNNQARNSDAGNSISTLPQNSCYAIDHPPDAQQRWPPPCRPIQALPNSKHSWGENTH
jgi:hypothetical protein